jgi:hypothetical protein
MRGRCSFVANRNDEESRDRPGTPMQPDPPPWKRSASVFARDADQHGAEPRAGAEARGGTQKAGRQFVAIVDVAPDPSPVAAMPDSASNWVGS